MKFFFLLLTAMLSLAGAALFADEFAQVAGPDISRVSPNYLTNRAPLSPSIFIKLPVGAVTPNGWLGRYMELQRDGLTGKLGKLSIWLEKNDNAWLSEGGSHGWEEVPYWLRGYADLAYILKDADMIAEAQIWIDSIIEHQSPSGYFGMPHSKNLSFRYCSMTTVSREKRL